jgi:hypothetical protein
MRVRFVRTAGQPDRVYVRRSNGSELSWSFPSFGADLPHDLVHLVVERAFGVKNGFWGRVDAGVDPLRVNAMANRTGGPIRDKYAGFGDDLSELLLAEALANLSWPIPELTDSDRMKMAEAECAKHGLSLPASVTIDSLGTVRAELDELRKRWRALIPKGTLELTFEP